MMIGYRLLPAYIPMMCFPVDVITENGGVFCTASEPELRYLIDNELVYAIGSRSRAKQVMLIGSPVEAQKRIDAHVTAIASEAREARQTREHTPLETLMRYVSARKTIFREHLATMDGDVAVRTGHWVFSHKHY